MFKAGLKAGLIAGAILFILFLLLFVLGLLSPDLAVIGACFVLLLALPLFVIAGRLAARFSGGSAPGAGALAGVVAVLMATPALVSLVVVETVSHPQLMTSYMNSDTPQSLENSGVSTEDFSVLAGLGGTLLTCLTLGPVVAASLGAFGSWIRLTAHTGQTGTTGAVVQPQEPSGNEMPKLDPQPAEYGADPERPSQQGQGIRPGCISAAVVMVVVVAICVGTFLAIDSGTPDLISGLFDGASPEGQVRNCIKSIFPGNDPSCSDYDGVPKPTTLNGVYFDTECTWVDSDNRCRQD